MEEMQRTRYGERGRGFHTFSGGLSPRIVHQHGNVMNHLLLSFYGGFITQARLIKSLAIGK